jgi:glycosyltransferase involved in cell wall biosynthesis
MRQVTEMEVVFEVVTGLGVGGAEKILRNRLQLNHEGFRIIGVDTRPVLTGTEVRFFEYYGLQGSILKKMASLVNLYKPKLIITRTPRDLLRLVCVKIFSQEKFLLVHEVHNLYASPNRLANFILKHLIRVVSSKVDIFVAVSRAVQKGDQVPKCRESLLKYMGSSLEFSTKTVNKFGDFNFLFVGRLVKVKRPIWLLERIEHVQDEIRFSKARFTFLGDGPELKHLSDAAYKMGILDLVEIKGKVADPTPFFRNADVLVSTSTKEGLPLVFFEAKLANLRILATDSGGGREILDGNDLLVNVDDERGFENAMLEMLRHPSRVTESSSNDNLRKFDASFLQKHYYKEILTHFAP